MSAARPGLVLAFRSKPADAVPARIAAAAHTDAGERTTTIACSPSERRLIDLARRVAALRPGVFAVVEDLLVDVLADLEGRRL